MDFLFCETRKVDKTDAYAESIAAGIFKIQ